MKSQSDFNFGAVVCILSASAILLAILNFRPTNILPKAAATTGNFQKPPVATSAPANGGENDSKPAIKEQRLAFEWKPVESEDYKTYIANLRKLSFPEPLIREMIVADINKLYAPREEPLRWQPPPHDADLSERRKQPTLEDMEKLIKLRDLQIEKQDVLEQLLGVSMPREFIRTPNSRNYEAYEYAISQLPPEKQKAIQRLHEDEVLTDDLNQTKYGGYGSRDELQEYRALNDKIHAAMQEILTPEEYQRYLMNSSPPGTEMARRIIGMEPTDQEMLKIWEHTHEQWKEQGGVYGRWHAERRTGEETRAADEKLATNLRAALGPDRYLDYQMAVDETGQQLRNFASRYDLPRETLAAAFDLQTQIDKTAASMRQFEPSGANVQFIYRGVVDSPGQSLSIDQLFTELRGKLEQTLGPDLYNKWNAGRKLSYDLQPE